MLKVAQLETLAELQQVSVVCVDVWPFGSGIFFWGGTLLERRPINAQLGVQQSIITMTFMTQRLTVQLHG